MPRLSPLPPPLDSAPFSVRQAQAASVSRQRLRAADLVSPFHGVRSAVPVDSILELCCAYLPRMTGGQFFSHRTAALIYGMPLPRALESPRWIHVAVSPPAHPPQLRGVTGHRVSAETRTHGGLPVVDPVACWRQLAPSLSTEELVVVGDFLVRRKQPLATLEQLRDAASEGRGRGIRSLRLALTQVRAGTDSPMETRVRLALVASGLPEPLIGHTVRDSDRGFVATPDLAYVDKQIAIEYEGEAHWTDRRVFAEDIERRERLEDAGWHVIRVIAEHLGAKAPLLVRRVRAARAAR